jgi:hypothetical protein
MEFPGFGDLLKRTPGHGPTEIEKLQVWHVDQFSFRDPEDWPVLYRAHDSARFNDELRIWFSTYRIVRYTACGVWIARGAEGEKFVNLRADRKWACTTKTEAIYSLKRRRAKQVQLLMGRLEDAKDLLAYIEKIV